MGTQNVRTLHVPKLCCTLAWRWLLHSQNKSPYN